MHEYSVVQALLERVDAEVDVRGAKAVHRVRLRIGPLAGVEIDLLESAWEVCRRRTPCEDADLEIVRVKARWSCPVCRKSIPAGSVLKCDRCGTAAQLTEGDELVLERVELEVP
jgi:hydrogenase nickel incorporation protein HypA/HybF